MSGISMRLRATLFALGSLPLLAQAPKVPDVAFFSQDPKVLMILCAEEAKALMSTRDTHLLAEYGDTYLAKGDRAKAEEAFTKAAALSPNDPQTHHLIGLAWLRKGFKAEALASYKAMTEVSLAGRYENRKNIFTKAAVDLISAGYVAEAAAYMESGYQLDKRDEHNFLDFARAAWFANQRDLAATYFARAVKAAGGDEDVWIEIANIMGDHLLAQRKPKVP